ncbi:MAG: hypothetical protein RLZZ536_2522, partial [Planctomycetota bacterium]
MSVPTGKKISTTDESRSIAQALTRGRLLLAALGILAAAFLPTLLVYYRQLWSREHYQFFPFAIAVMLGFAVFRCDPL